MNSITRGSALSAPKGSRSALRHGRRMRRSVVRVGRGSGMASRRVLLEAFQYVHRVDADLVHGIAAFHDEQGRHAHAGDALADAEIIVMHQLELGDRVLLV